MPLGVLAGVLACLLGVAGVAGAQEGAGPSAPALSATVEQCITASTAAGRSVTFTGQMETVLGAHRMAIQILVQEHTSGEPGFHTLTADGLGTWQRSEAGVKIYKYVRQVTDLPAPALYRAIVDYRWMNEKGRVVRSDERRTAICRQPGARSDSTGAPTPGGTAGGATGGSSGGASGGAAGGEVATTTTAVADTASAG
jgi:hypothetical protein